METTEKSVVIFNKINQQENKLNIPNKKTLNWKKHNNIITLNESP